MRHLLTIKTIKITASALLLLISLPLVAATQDGSYLTVFGGFASVPDNVANKNFGRVDYHSGYDIGTALGYQSGPLRYEGEINYIRAKVRQFRFSNVTALKPDGNTRSLAAMANIFYDFTNADDIIVPFLGAGVGFARVKARLNSQNTPVFSESSLELAYQGMAGVNFNVGENTTITASYRYFTSAHSDDLNKRFQTHMGNIGIIYRLT